MTLSKKNIIVSVLFLMQVATAFFAWRFLFQAIRFDATRGWIVLAVFFSAISVLFLLQAVFVQPWFVRGVTAFAVLIPMLFLPFSVEIGIAFLLAGYFLFRSTSVVGKETFYRLKVQVFSCAKQGIFPLVIGWSFAISGAYIGLLHDTPVENLLPKVSFSQGLGQGMLRLVEKSNPGLIQLSNTNPTVDEFLFGVFTENVPTPSNVIDPAIQGMLGEMGVSEQDIRTRLEEEKKNAFLSEGRKKLSDLLHRSVNGGERMLDVLSELVNAKLLAISGMSGGRSGSTDSLRGILGLLFFLTILSVGSVLGFVWAWFAWLIFLFLRISGLVVLQTKLREVEEISEI